MGFSGGSALKESSYIASATGDMGLIPGSGRSPRGGHDNPLQYSCLENPMDSGTWWATVHGFAKSWTQLKQLSMHLFPLRAGLALMYLKMVVYPPLAKIIREFFSDIYCGLLLGFLVIMVRGPVIVCPLSF